MHVTSARDAAHYCRRRRRRRFNQQQGFVEMFMIDHSKRISANKFAVYLISSA
jgi:hypothetical protein